VQSYSFNLYLKIKQYLQGRNTKANKKLKNTLARPPGKMPAIILKRQVTLFEEDASLSSINQASSVPQALIASVKVDRNLYASLSASPMRTMNIEANEPQNEITCSAFEFNTNAETGAIECCNKMEIEDATFPKPIQQAEIKNTLEITSSLGIIEELMLKVKQLKDEQDDLATRAEIKLEKAEKTIAFLQSNFEEASSAVCFLII
jgi:hypothetical protein